MEPFENVNPRWVGPGDSINEILFCDQFLLNHQMIYVGGSFFTREGKISDEMKLRQMIFSEIQDYLTSSAPRKVESIVNTLKIMGRCDDVGDNDRTIHLANGTFVLAEGFTPGRLYCRHRLPVAYNPDAPEPELWLSFLHDLLEEEDILTLQEFMGYCLVPTNMAQKMLIITGRGGEGKSRIGVVMKDLLGENMNVGSIAKVEQSPFARADLENILLMVDDDLKMERLKQTNYLKSIITAEVPMDLERKGIQSYQGMLNCRFMAFGNGTLQALNDKSYGFFRRQIILSTKERPRDRVDDPYLSLRLKRETEGIFLWALEGIYRLAGNDYRFTLSEKSKRNMRESMAENANALDFLLSEGYVVRKPEGKITSKMLFALYLDWCEDNSLDPMSRHEFIRWVKENQSQFELEYTTNIQAGNGRRVRGFKGLAAATL